MALGADVLFGSREELSACFRDAHSTFAPQSSAKDANYCQFQWSIWKAWIYSTDK